MPRITRNSKLSTNTSENPPNLPNKFNMAAKPDLILQDVLDQMKTQIDTLDVKLEKKIDENANRVTASIKSSEKKLDTIDKNTAELNRRIEILEKQISVKDTCIGQLSKKISDLEQEKRNHNVILEGLHE